MRGLSWPVRQRRATPSVTTLTRQQCAWLLAAAALSLAPHVSWLPAWIMGFGFALLGWRSLLLWRGSAPPPRLVLLALAIAAAISVRAEFDHFFGKDPGVALLALLLGLKLLEVRVTRDALAVVLLCFFLQLSLFFEDQSIPVAGLALAATLSGLAAMASLSDANGRAREQLRTGTLLVAQGAPFMVLLFMLFPRADGPLWGLPADAFSGRTGLSDTMSPGSISALGESSEIVFRADFDGPPPRPDQRYWRGPVLTDFDGRTWRPRAFAEGAAPFYTVYGPRLNYTLTLEPHNRRWLLALDVPAAGADARLFTSDFQLLARQPVQSRIRVELASHPESLIGLTESDAVLAAARRLPAAFNPRTLALADELAAGAESHEAILRRVITHLRQSELIYTLRPPLLGSDSVDEFLFDTRRGFCEHFAGAFTVLMRAAGVPARVVTGYQGGEINPIDGNLVVRQSHAHAWSEVWLEGRGWVRVDPTALSAPRRIDDGLAAALPEGEALPIMMHPRMEWLRGLRLRWEAVSNAWNQRVLGYNPQRQKELLARLGLDQGSSWMLGGAIAGAGALLFGLLLWWATRKRRPADPLERVWMRFCTTLARHGIARQAWEGPHQFGTRIASEASMPSATREAIRAVCEDYARLRYGPKCSADDMRALRTRINAIRLP
ncbi:transglutaminase TgpA family protein [Thauera humireducens]|uniref:Transglutaminase n=1 Tax=Thauera humireducens TaxID=1134435 RepID=A0A140ID21_9RHOO|nr:DUF3488 and transglutaminase-like domain-containing protein [Thauera humireducens]AMO35646.1 transglutaminase [Thauera humireducens]